MLSEASVADTDRMIRATGPIGDDDDEEEDAARSSGGGSRSRHVARGGAATAVAVAAAAPGAVQLDRLRAQVAQLQQENEDLKAQMVGGYGANRDSRPVVVVSRANCFSCL